MRKHLLLTAFLFPFFAFSEDYSAKDLGFIEDNPLSFHSPKLQEKAEQGDPEAQFYISRCYKYGWGVEKSEQDSEKWLLKSVDSKYPPSLVYYANELIAEKNKNKNWEKAFELLEQAHRQKYHKGTTSLAYFLQDKSSDPINTQPKKYVDAKKSNELLLQAAQAGEAGAQATLGNRIIMKGTSCDQLKEITSVEKQDGVRWLENAAYNLESNAIGDLVAAYKYGCNEIEKNEDLQKRWEFINFCVVRRLISVAECDDSYLQEEIALLYLNGKGTEKNPAKAFVHMYDAVLNGNKDAKYKLGYFFEKGIGIPANPDEAKKWYLECKKDPYTRAKFEKALQEDEMISKSDLAKAMLLENETANNPQHKL